MWTFTNTKLYNHVSYSTMLVLPANHISPIVLKLCYLIRVIIIQFCRPSCLVICIYYLFMLNWQILCTTVTWLSTQDCRARSRVADRTSRVITQHVWPWTIVSAMIREHIARFCRIWKRVVALQPQQQAIFSSPPIYAYFSSGSLKVATLVVPFLCCFCLVFICCWTSCMQYLTIPTVRRAVLWPD
jgi:hypothetical protein